MWVLIAFLLLLTPRFFLLSIEGTGVRIEDILLLLLLPATVQVLKYERHRMGPVIWSFAMYFGIVLLSASLAGISGTLSLPVSIAFGIRPALYFCAFVVGWQIGLHSRNGQYGVLLICKWVLFINLAWGLGVSIGVLPNVASFTSERLAGLTNGPYELSGMLCLISVSLLWMRSFLSVGAGTAGLLWTQSRIAVAAFLIYSAFSVLRVRIAGRFLILAIAILLIVVVVSMRDSTEISSSENLFQLSTVWDRYSEAVTTREDYFYAAYSDSANTTIMSGEGDPSLLLRAARWSVVFSTAGGSLNNLLFGMGPSFYSVALDGNYVRLLGETGLIGLLSFVLVGLRLKKSVLHPGYRNLMLALLIQLAIIGLFIDIFVSLKVMCLFWMMVGALQREDQKIKV